MNKKQLYLLCTFIAIPIYADIETQDAKTIVFSDALFGLLKNVSNTIDHTASSVGTIEERMENLQVSASILAQAFLEDNSCMGTICSTIDSFDNKLNNIYNAVKNDTPCPPVKDCCNCDFTIAQSDLLPNTPFSITKPGVWCVVDNLISTADPIIIINSHNVVLDLQNHHIIGDTHNAAITFTTNNVTIQNGTVQNIRTGVNKLNPIANTTIRNMSIINFKSRGINISGYGDNFCIENCKCISTDLIAFDQIPPAAYFIGGVEFVILKNCMASLEDHSGLGFHVIGKYCNILDCQTFGCSDGFNSANGNNSVTYANCLATNASQSGFDFDIGVQLAPHITVQNCVARNCFLGFTMRKNVVLDHCIAYDNIQAGFRIFPANPTDNTIINCIAHNNAIGFDNLSTTTNFFGANCAFSNSIQDFVNVPNVQNLAAGSAPHWSNVKR